MQSEWAQYKSRAHVNFSAVFVFIYGSEGCFYVALILFYKITSHRILYTIDSDSSIWNMAYITIALITALISIGLPASAAEETTSAATSTTTPASTTPGCINIDIFTTGKWGNPGARAFLCEKSIDAVHEYVSDMISRAIVGMIVTDLVLPVGTGTLTIKPPRITEASFGKSEYKLVPPNRIQSRFYEGHMAANGIWQYKPHVGDLVGGTYKSTIRGSELNATNQLGRTFDAKPVIQPVECKANMSQFRIEIKGSNEITAIENCDMDICKKIRGFFEGTICQLFEAFVKEVLNRELQHYPTRMSIQGDEYRVDYGLLSGEPTVNDSTKCIRAGLEGKYIWRGWTGVPFNAPDMDWMDRDRMFSFQVSDFTFNTLLYQAHASGHRFSAAELASASMQQLLSLNCCVSLQTTAAPTTTTTPKPTKPNVRKYFYGDEASLAESRVSLTGFLDLKCLGSLFANFTNFGPYKASDKGDIVFKTGQSQAAVYIHTDKHGDFRVLNGVLEFYGPIGSGGNRPLLARLDVRSMHGEFVPKLNKVNSTGTVKIAEIKLAHSQTNIPAITPEWLETAGQFVEPIITDMFNGFFDRYAQFPVPLPKHYKCESPELTILARTMQIDCDIERHQHTANCDSGEETGEEEDGDRACKCFRNTCVC